MTVGQQSSLTSRGNGRVALAQLARSRLAAVGIGLVALIGAVCIANPAFASIQNARDLLVQSSPVVIVGCGMTLVVLTGEIDISVGSLFGLLAALIGLMASPTHLGLSSPVVITLTLLAGAAAGCLNGLLVTLGRVPAIVATLGMLTVLHGVTELLLAGNWITDLPTAIRTLGTGTLLGVPYSVCVAGAVAAVLGAIATFTPWGLRLRAIGGNAEAARLYRIPVRTTKLLAFTVVGLLTGVAAVVCVPQQSVIESGIGVGFELVVVTAVVVGGTSIRGGTGGVAGTVLAALLLGSIRTALIFLKFGDMATFWERAIQGAFILVAVLADHLSRARRNSTTEHAD